MKEHSYGGRRTRPLVKWSPHDDTSFVLANGTGLKLFETSVETDGTGKEDVRAEGKVFHKVVGSPVQRPHTGTWASHQANSHGDLVYGFVTSRAMTRPARCLDWYTGDVDSLLVATGDSVGTIQLISLQDDISIDSNGVIQEFSPVQSRQCNAVCWDPVNTNILAVGMDKLRNDHSIFFWDMNRTFSDIYSVDTSQNRASSGSGLDDFELPPPPPVSRFSSRNGFVGKKHQYELGLSEGAVAMSWVPERPMCLATGTSFKWLRVYDIRMGSSMKRPAPLSVVAHSKSVRGVCFDPGRPQCLATFSEEDQIKTWDIRKLDNAVAIIECNSKNITQIAWSPHRSGLLAAINTDERCVSVWDVGKLGNSVGWDSNALVDGEKGSSSTAAMPVPRGNRHDLHNSSKTSARASDDKGDKEEVQKTIFIRKCDIRRYTARTPASFCWVPPRTGEGIDASYINDDISNAMESRQVVRLNEGDTNLFSQQQSTLLAHQNMNRVLFVAWAGALDDISLQDPLPISLSSSSDICFGFNSSLLMLSFAHQDPSTVFRERAKLNYSISPEKNIQLLTHVIGVTKKVIENGPQIMQELSTEDTNVAGVIDQQYLKPGMENLIRVRDMWKWIERASSLMVSDTSRGLVDAGVISVLSRRTSAQNETRLDERQKSRFEVYISKQRTFALRLCGWRALGTSEDVLFEPVDMHASDTMFGQTHQDYQRQAAIAVFCCDLRRAIKILQNAAEHKMRRNKQKSMARSSKSPNSTRRGGHQDADATKEVENGGDEGFISDLLQLVAMAFAGYPDHPIKEGTTLWFETSIHLLKRLKDFPMLRASLGFLVENFLRRRSSTLGLKSGKEDASGEKPDKEGPVDGGMDTSKHILEMHKSDGDTSGQPSVSTKLDDDHGRFNFDLSTFEDTAGYACVTEEEAFSLSDRVAFACRFLPDAKLYSFLAGCYERARKRGDLSGIVLTGLGEHGLQLIQTYVDRTGDVQTAALASCHAVFSALPHAEAVRLSRWIAGYRDLLNSWQLWQERARFDVAFSKRERQRTRLKVEVPEGTAEGTSKRASTTDKQAGANSSVAPKSGSSETNTSISNPQGWDLDSNMALKWLMEPTSQDSQLYVVCQYCKESLLLSTLLGDGASLGAAGRINRRKLTLPCCPRCKKTALIVRCLCASYELYQSVRPNGWPFSTRSIKGVSFTCRGTTANKRVCKSHFQIASKHGAAVWTLVLMVSPMSTWWSRSLLNGMVFVACPLSRV
mmetsp:Transcript_9262/g.20127  ORF Transcript_9262/g.20127 Transcript_9262/m.20127 type:complete len:1246 (-) Transcript_9262:218-3955(-)